jgi:hypothetical protein
MGKVIEFAWLGEKFVLREEMAATSCCDTVISGMFRGINPKKLSMVIGNISRNPATAQR